MFLKSEHLESLNKDLDEGIKNDNSGFIFKKNILPSIVRSLSILKIFNFAEPYMSRIVRINQEISKKPRKQKLYVSCHNRWTFFNIRWFVLTKFNRNAFLRNIVLFWGDLQFFNIFVFLWDANKAHFSYGWFMPIIHSPVDEKWSEKDGQIDWQWTTDSKVFTHSG